jgi:hypothetical protein
MLQLHYPHYFYCNVSHQYLSHATMPLFTPLQYNMHLFSSFIVCLSITLLLTCAQLVNKHASMQACIIPHAYMQAYQYAFSLKRTVHYPALTFVTAPAHSPRLGV